MIGHCQNGPSRRLWLRTLSWRLSVGDLLAKARSITALIAEFLAFALTAALLVVAILLLLADAATHDPVTTKQPTSAPAAQPLRRMT